MTGKTKMGKLCLEFKRIFEPSQKCILGKGIHEFLIPFDTDGVIHGSNLKKAIRFAEAKGLFIFLDKRGLVIRD